jgi:hypothetical protein
MREGSFQSELVREAVVFGVSCCKHYSTPSKKK